MLIKETTLTGVLVADQWKANGKITGLALLTDNESKYLISPDDLDQDINLLLRKRIQVRVILSDTPEERIFRVKKFMTILPTEKQL